MVRLDLSHCEALPMGNVVVVFGGRQGRLTYGLKAASKGCHWVTVVRLSGNFAVRLSVPRAELGGRILF